MAKLSYKTRGNTSPQGKPKVYFCCHPGDFPLYFDPVSDEILEKQNCSVWYLQDPESPRDEALLEDLRQMQLFVMPVTTNLLYSDSSALEVEFPFAVENHIPVLPLMQETGLEARFNEKCGALQFLDKHTVDETAIGYDQKLESYLSSVLIGDEQAEKIRAAFDAYVFLSYRKKDRKYAQELMRLIHKNDFCRDIAIWYDEFLTPGENFNDSIQKALDKSGLFVLTVTPNLVNESNYIKDIEYPLAKQSGKPILPAELVPTDPARLACDYPGIPKSTDAHDEAALSQALQDAMKQIAIRENDTSAEHLFFIGLAYLGGVDVEVDHEKAVDLITAAADAGLVEAMAKLADMYRNGIGVARSYEAAIAWQEKLIRQLKLLLRKKPDSETLNKWFDAVRYCGGCCWELRDQRRTEEVYRKALRDIRHLPLRLVKKEKARFRAAFLSSLGNLSMAQADYDTAKAYYDKAMQLFEKAAQEDPTVKRRRDLSIGCCKLGDVSKAKGDLPGAREYYLKMLAITEELAQTDELPYLQDDLSVSYDKLGGLCHLAGDMPGAMDYHRKSLAICEQLAKETGTPRSMENLGISYSQVGNLCTAMGDLMAAREYFEKALQISEDLAQKNDTLTNLRNLALSHGNLGRVCSTLKDHPAAKEHLEAAVTLCTQLRERCDTLEARSALARLQFYLGGAYFAAEEYMLAIHMLRTAVSGLGAIVHSTRLLRARTDLAACYGTLGDAYIANGDACQEPEYYADAKECYQKALRLSTELAAETGEWASRVNVCNANNQLGDICRRIKEPAAAKRYYHTALRLGLALLAQVNNLHIRWTVAFTYDKLGCYYRGEGNLPAAKAYFEEELSMLSSIYKESTIIDVRSAMAACRSSLGRLFWKENNLTKAKEHYQNALALRQGIHAELNSFDSKGPLARSYETLGRLCTAAKEWSEAREHFENALQLFDELQEEDPAYNAYDKYLTRKADACYRLGTVCKELKDYKSAKDYYQRALWRYAEIEHKNPTADNRDDLALVHYRLSFLSTGDERKEHLQKGLALCETLSKEFPDSQRYQKNLALFRDLLEK